MNFEVADSAGKKKKVKKMTAFRPKKGIIHIAGSAKGDTLSYVGSFNSFIEFSRVNTYSQ